MIDLKEYGYEETEQAPEGCIPARVSAVHRGAYRLVCAYGEVGGKLKGGVYYQPDGVFNEGYGSELYPTVGDFVWLQYQGAGDSLIAGTLPRRSSFSRRAAHQERGEQIVAANFDSVFILMSMNRDFNLKRLERYLTAAWQSGALPVVALTKADLAEDAARCVREAERVAAGTEVLAVSAFTGEGLERLAACLQPGKTVVFLGSSGVGKSSLVNALAGEELMRVSGIREEDSRGRHTTTHRQLLRLPSGALVIDTPGMRELGMWDVSDGLESTFSDVEELFTRCRFKDCAHGGEPGCAVRAALADGSLDAARWENYQSLQREARFTEKKELTRQIRQRKAASWKRQAREKSVDENAD